MVQCAACAFRTIDRDQKFVHRSRLVGAPQQNAVPAGGGRMPKCRATMAPMSANVARSVNREAPSPFQYAENGYLFPGLIRAGPGRVTAVIGDNQQKVVPAQFIEQLR